MEIKNPWHSEGNAYYKRNAGKTNIENDHILEVIKKYDIIPHTALEIGCFDGFRLDEIYRAYGADVTGIDISRDAINAGLEKFPCVRFSCSSIEESNLQEKFDVVIVNYVLHWILRDNLFKAIDKIDGYVQEGGYLIIGDFAGLGKFRKVDYHHLLDAGIYTYKQDYQNIFTASGKYELISYEQYNCDNKTYRDINERSAGMVCVLKKT